MPSETRFEPSSQIVALERIDSAPFQIRQNVDEEPLRSLASSMQERGLLQPIVVRPKGERFEVVVGERRLRAAKLLQWSTIACRVAERSDLDAEIDKVVENEQREDAKPLERARAYAHLRDEFHLDQDEIARRVGVHKSVVSRLLALLKQPEEIQKLVGDESISPGHLRPLESIADESKRIELAQQAAKQRLTVRETERRVREAARNAGTKTNDAAIASAPAKSEKIHAEEHSDAALVRATEKAPAEMPTRVTDASGDVAGLHSTEAIVKASAETTKCVTEESNDPEPRRATEPIVKSPLKTRKRAVEESSDAATQRSTEPSVGAPTEVPTTVASESTGEQPKPRPVAAQAAVEQVPPRELERRMQLSATNVPRETFEQRLAKWCIELASVVRGPMRNAILEFYERMTEAATWWRIIKRVLHFLARFIPGREPEPTKLQKAIKECFSFLPEPPPTEPKPQPKKPDAEPPKAA